MKYSLKKPKSGISHHITEYFLNCGCLGDIPEQGHYGNREWDECKKYLWE